MKFKFYFSTLDGRADELELAGKVILAQAKDGAAAVSFFGTSGSPHSELKVDEKGELFSKVFSDARSCKADYAVVSFAPVYMLDLQAAMEAMAGDEGIRSRAVSVAVGKIEGKAMKLSPKVPFFYDSLVILNIGRLDALGVFGAGSCGRVVSHFFPMGGWHAYLNSFVEGQVPYGEVYVYSDGSGLRNKFGELNRRYPFTYLYDGKFRAVRADAADAAARALRDIALRKVPGLGGAAAGGRATVEIDGTVFFRRTILERALLLVPEMMKAVINLGFFNYEFRKTYGAGK